MILTKKIQVTSLSKEFWEMMRELDYKSYKMANRCMQVHYLNQFMEEHLVKDQTKDVANPDLKEARKRVANLIYKENYTTSKQNCGYQVLSEEFSDVSSYVRSAMSDLVFKHYKADFTEVVKGNQTQRSYKRGMPIPFTASTFKNMTDVGFTWCKHEVMFVYGRDMSGNKKMIERVLQDAAKVEAGTDEPKENLYQLASSSFKFKGKKLFLYLCVNIPDKQAGLDESVTAFVDITFKCPVLVSSNVSKEVVSIGNPENMLSLRTQMNRRMSQLQSGMKFNGGKNGSRNGKTGGLWEKLHNKQHDIANTENHKITKHVINQVLRLKAKHIVIKVDKAKELPENIKNYMIPYFDHAMISEKIVYKAKQHGIEVEVVEVGKEAV
jgi:hypothetical protein